jgi:DNA polymerase III epsilon subunit-like protein
LIPRRILFVDVQASGSPGKGILIEVAWKEAGLDPHSFLVRNTGEETIPVRVQQITGITDDDIKGGNSLHPDELKKLFLAASGFDGQSCEALLAAHYASYEKRWLDWLTGQNLEFLCTLELAREKVPDLFSGTLRAVAGVVGFSLGEKRRAVDHVLATEAIFNALHTHFTPVSVERNKRLALPGCPGVYRFIDPCFMLERQKTSEAELTATLQESRRVDMPN